MALPVIFSDILSPRRPTLAELDENFAALGALVVVPGTVVGTNNIVFTQNADTPAIVQLAPYKIFSFIAAGTNTASVMISIAGLAAIGVYKDTPSGPAPLAGGEIVAQTYTTVIYDPLLNNGAGAFHLGVSPSLGVATTSGVDIAGGQSIIVAPTGNAFPTLSSYNVQGTTTAPAQREFLVNFGFVSNKGAGLVSPDTDKSTLYVGMQAVSGTGDVWAANMLTEMAGGSGSYNSHIVEFDLNNLNAARGNVPGIGGLIAPVSYGVTISGVPGFNNTAAVVATGANWNRGFVSANNVLQAGFQDVGTSEIAFDARGAHLYGLDMAHGTFSQAPIRLPNNQFIKARDIGDTTDIIVIGLTTNDDVLIGDNTINNVVAYGATIPITDGTFVLGGPANRWSEVYAVNGTINTSDPTQKKDMSPLPDMEGFIDAIEPIQFRWKRTDGGFVEVEETRRVHATERKEWDEPVIIYENGRAIQTTQRKHEDVPIYDTVEVKDENGAQVFDERPARPAVFSPDGRTLLVPARAAQRWPKKERFPRMVDKRVKVKKLVYRPGERLHFGFDASQIRAYIEATEQDFGAYVRSEDGVEGLRIQELVAVLWDSHRKLKQRVKRLEDEHEDGSEDSGAGA